MRIHREECVMFVWRSRRSTDEVHPTLTLPLWHLTRLPSSMSLSCTALPCLAEMRSASYVAQVSKGLGFMKAHSVEILRSLLRAWKYSTDGLTIHLVPSCQHNIQFSARTLFCPEKLSARDCFQTESFWTQGGHLYCVAPVLSLDPKGLNVYDRSKKLRQTSGRERKVSNASFWVTGVDCCARRGAGHLQHVMWKWFALHRQLLLPGLAGLSAFLVQTLVILGAVLFEGALGGTL